MNLRKDHYWFHFSFTWVNEQNLACEVCVHSQIELDLKLLVSTTSNCVLKFVLSRNMLYSWTDYDCVVKNIKNYWKILSGGSLGSYVDEGRSKMREIVWIAGHIEHRYSERKLQCKACLCTTPVWGSLLNHSTLLRCRHIRVCETLCVHSLWWQLF